ncbi:hypothetical protein [Streptomyces sp. SLBN-118]|uniref:hypothetical protein n=1 Tax=Streptomyces sp. SLBN-118 TaxID=2768454 RepID=UPI0011525229|nr:hypothetical protein [Streptomyces sp. SLBN-118]
MPGSEAAPQFGRPSAGGTLRCGGNAEGVDPLVGKLRVAEALVPAPGLATTTDWHWVGDHAPGGVAGVPGGCRRPQRVAHGAADAVRADHKVGVQFPAVVYNRAVCVDLAHRYAGS